MAYNSAYTGPQIDEAIGAVKQKESTWDSKQDKLSGTNDQLVGFNSAGEATAVPKPTAADVGAMPAVSGGTTGQVLTKTETGQEWQDAPDGLPSGGEEGQVLTKTASGAQWDDVPSDLPSGGTQGQVLTKGDGETVEWSDPASGLPSGGTPGQMLYQGESGPEWGDKPVMYVTVTENASSPNGMSADKTAKEIHQAFTDGYAVFVVIIFLENLVLPLYSSIEVEQETYVSRFQVYEESGALTLKIVFDHGDSQVEASILKTSATNIVFTPGTTGLTAKNVQDAIEEVNAKIPATPKRVTVTLPASGWSSNTQTVTVSGVLADETAQLIQPMPAIASQDAYISAGVICSGQAANSLTFTCQEVPTSDLTVYVVIQEVTA